MKISKYPQWKYLPHQGKKDFERYLKNKLSRFPINLWFLAILLSIFLVLYQSHDWLKFVAWFGGGLAIYIDLLILKRILLIAVNRIKPSN